MSSNYFASGRRCAGWAGTVLRLGACAGMLSLAGCASVPGDTAGAPGPDDRRFEQATAALHDGREQEAIALVTALVADYPDLPGPLVNLGILHATAGRDEDAERALLQAVEIAPGDAVAWAELGIVRRKLGRFAAADEAYRMSLSLDPDYALAWRNRGVLLDLYMGRPGEAQECYERYLALVGGQSADEQVARWVAELQLRNSSRVATR
jgi:Flp pilus assembly protein TadD